MSVPGIKTKDTSIKNNIETLYDDKPSDYDKINMDEILRKIFSFSSCIDLNKILLVCSKFHQISSQTLKERYVFIQQTVSFYKKLPITYITRLDSQGFGSRPNCYNVRYGKLEIKKNELTDEPIYTLSISKENKNSNLKISINNKYLNTEVKSERLSVIDSFTVVSVSSNNLDPLTKKILLKIGKTLNDLLKEHTLPCKGSGLLVC